MKICDAIHGFIRFGELERQVIDSRPFQRLRYIRQMGVTYLVYPGANQTRFEHSLGVMELASRIYDTLLEESVVPLPEGEEEQAYWRQILRMAALCHDMGHLPFSHTAEKALLPEGGHERMTLALIQSDELREIWRQIPGKREAEADIIKLAVQEEELAELGTDLKLTPWERVLSQVITEDNFGADRIDYLIRDATYTGVGYGHFDFHQLIDSLRILPSPQDPAHLSIGVAINGVQSVESLWIARYLMFARVYHHSKSRLYSHHMKHFMTRHYQEGGIPTSVEGYLGENDALIFTALWKSAQEGDSDACALLKQGECYREVPLASFSEKKVLSILPELEARFEEDLFIDAKPTPSHPGTRRHFSVLTEEGEVISSSEASQFLREIPLGATPLSLFASPNAYESVKQWLQEKAPRESDQQYVHTL